MKNFIFSAVLFVFFIVSNSALAMQEAHCAGCGKNLEISSVGRELLKKTTLPDRVVGEYFLRMVYPDFSSSDQCKTMLDTLYSIPNIQNLIVMSKIDDAIAQYRGKPQNDEEPVDSTTDTLLRFFITYSNDPLLIPPVSQEFFDKELEAMQQFCKSDTNDIRMCLYAQGMTKYRIKHIFKAFFDNSVNNKSQDKLILSALLGFDLFEILLGKIVFAEEDLQN